MPNSYTARGWSNAPVVEGQPIGQAMAPYSPRAAVAAQRLQLDEQRFDRQLQMDEHKTRVETGRLALDAMKFYTEQEQQMRAEEDSSLALRDAALATQELAAVGRNWRDPDWEIKVAEIQAKYPLAEMNPRFAKQLDTYRGVHTKFLERQNEVIAKFQERYHADPVLNEDGVTINTRESMKIVEENRKARAAADLAAREPVGRVFENDEQARAFVKENPGATFRFNSQGQMVAVEDRPNVTVTEEVDASGNTFRRTVRKVGRGAEEAPAEDEADSLESRYFR